MGKLNNLIFKLQQNNYKGFYLSLLRVLLGCYLLKEILFKHQVWELLYSNVSKLNFNTHSAFIVSGINVDFLKSHYQFVIALYVFSLFFFVFGIGKKIISFLCFVLLFTLQKMNNVEVNGGDALARFVLFCISFSNCFEYLCIKPKTINSKGSNLVSNLAALSIMIQLCIAYFVAFSHKLCNIYWQNGTAMYYVLQTENFLSGSINYTLAQNKFFVYFSTYYTLLIECLFPIFVWLKFSRKYVLWLGFLLHFGIYCLMLVNNLQFIFLAIYGFFFSNNFLLRKYFDIKKRLPFLR